MTVQETLQSVPKQEPMHGDLADFDVEGIEPFALPDEVQNDEAPAVLPDFMRHVDMANAANRTKDANPAGTGRSSAEYDRRPTF